MSALVGGVIGTVVDEAKGFLSTAISVISRFIMYLIDSMKEIMYRVLESAQKHPFEFTMGIVNLILFFG
jgi:hypothetical protein